MGKIGGFKEYDRINEDNIAVQERVSNYNEFTIPLAKDEIKEQGSRCMDCRNPVLSQLMSLWGI
jgi:glutamate synthase (NADPH/NADH) small chain